MSHLRVIIVLASILALNLSGFAQQRVHPPEGRELDHVHVRFRWQPLKGLLGNYFLQVVEDNGQPDPFTGNPAVVFQQVLGGDPRTVVTDGLEFGKAYAWRAIALVAPLPGVRAATPTHRFTTKTLPSFAPVITVTRPPGAGPVQPGVTIFNRRIGGNPLPGGLGYLVGVDEDGEYVWFYEYAARRVTDARQVEDGHFYWLMGSPVDAPNPGRAVEMTLYGDVIWISPGGEDDPYVHHECSRMPNGNGLVLTYEHRTFPGMVPSDWRGDRIIEYDRHTHEIVGEWNSFDHYSLVDHQLSGPGGDWTHGNSATFNPLDGCVYYSARHISRVTRIDWATKQVVYNMGWDLPSGDATFGDNLFSYQHAPQLLPNGNMVLFDNGNYLFPLTDPRQSAAIELAFDDPDNPTSAQVVWRYDLVDDLGDPWLSPFLGDADRLANGNTLLTDGPDTALYEVDANSQLVWKIKVGVSFPDGAIYRAERIDSLVKDTPGDIDDDWDLDMHDLAVLQNHFDGPVPGFPEKLSDTDGNGSLDVDDFDHFFRWMSGPPNFLPQIPNE